MFSYTKPCRVSGSYITLCVLNNSIFKIIINMLKSSLNQVNEVCILLIVVSVFQKAINQYYAIYISKDMSFQNSNSRKKI